MISAAVRPTKGGGSWYLQAACSHCSFTCATTTKPVKAGWKKPMSKRMLKKIALFTQSK